MANENEKSPDLMTRLREKAAARAKIVDEIARMLWESGEMLADTEGGSMPSWDEVRCFQMHSNDPDTYSRLYDWWAPHNRRAEALLNLNARQSLRLGQILIEHAGAEFEQLEICLWHKIERANGFERGSLTGKPGVKQQVAL